MNVFLDAVRDKPEEFLFASKDLSTSSVGAIAELFNQSNVLARSSGHAPTVLGPALRKHKLVTRGFDNAQIYEQVRSHCEPFIEYLEVQCNALDSSSPSVSSSETRHGADVDDSDVGEASETQFMEGDVSSDSDDDDEPSPPTTDISASSRTSSNSEQVDEELLDDKDIETQDDVEQYVSEMDKFSAELDRMMAQEDKMREKLRKREDDEEEDTDADDDMSDDDELARERRDRQVRREENEMGQTFQELELELEDSSNDDDVSSETGKSAAASIGFENFFGPRPSAEASKPKSTQSTAEGKNSKPKFQTEIDEDSAADDDESDDNGDWGQLSKFAKRQRKMAMRISELEGKIGADRSWELMGEASTKECPQNSMLEAFLDFESNVKSPPAYDRNKCQVETKVGRPENSLLETFLDFESNVKPPPVITEEFTKNLEDIITERIIAERFDDVERKLDLEENKKRRRIEVDVSNEKSEVGLGDLYAKQYIQEITGGPSEDEEKLDKEHAEIAQMYASLCYQLDSLSNFHFTPKPPREEMQVRTVNAPAIAMEEAIPVGVSKGTLMAPEEPPREEMQVRTVNAPSIAMEEAIPVGVSKGTLMAPEEVYEKKGDLVGDTEKDTDERRKARRTKKRKRRKARQIDASHRQARERQQDAAADDASGNPKRSKKGLSQSNLDVLGELSKKQKRSKGSSSANDTPMDSTKYTSSAEVFSKLQNERHSAPSNSKAAFRGVGVDETTRASNFKL